MGELEQKGLISSMKIFFDVDYTILGLDNTLRPQTKEIFQALLDENHQIFIWSGMGERWEVIEKHQLQQYVSGVYEKPTHHFHERLEELGVLFEPEFVIDDYPEVVAAFGGVWVPPYFFKRSPDREMERVYRIVQDFAATGTSEDRQYRAKGTVVPLF